MISVIVAVIVVLLDLITKYFAVVKLSSVGSVSVIKGILKFTYVENRGMAFGALQNARWVFLLVSAILIMVVLILIYKYHSKSSLFDISLGLILGGGVGNMIDRIRLGFVVDFIDFCAFDFWKWVFNIADSSVVVGTILLFIYLLFFDKIFITKQENNND